MIFGYKNSLGFMIYSLGLSLKLRFRVKIKCMKLRACEIDFWCLSLKTSD